MEIVIIREAIGWIANILFAYSPFPQARRSWKDKHSDGIEAQMLWVWFLGEALSVVYIALQSTILLPLLFNFTSNVILIGTILYFKYWGENRAYKGPGMFARARNKFLGWLMRTRLYNWMLKDVIPYIRFTTYYAKPSNKDYAKWGALLNEGYKHLKPGHIILTVDEKKLTTKLISLFTGEEGFSHAAQALSKDGKFEIAEMTHTDFTKSTWADICFESTRVVILECTDYDEEYVEVMKTLTPEFSDKPYDNMFKMGVEALSCAELCYMYDYENRLKVNLEPILGQKPYISPMGLYKGENMRVVWDSDLQE